MLASASQQGCPGSNLTCGGHTSVTQELITVKPNADWGLTRGGARCQWPRGLISVGGLAANDAHVIIAGLTPAATKMAAATRRTCAKGDGGGG